MRVKLVRKNKFSRNTKSLKRWRERRNGNLICFFREWEPAYFANLLIMEYIIPVFTLHSILACYCTIDFIHHIENNGIPMAS
jgi:hypothetical protein